MKRLWIALTIVLVALSACASDAYLVQFGAYGRSRDTLQLVWSSDILFFNGNAETVVVRCLGVSNGTAFDQSAVLTLPPHAVTALSGQPSVANSWLPNTPDGNPPPMWVVHLDVPAGVVLESRDQWFVQNGAIAGVPPPRLPQGKVSMPFFRALTPAGHEQVHVGTDLNGWVSRANVGVYNGGAEPATATVEVRRACDGLLLSSYSLTVAANTIVQVNALASTAAASDCTTIAAPNEARYTTVTLSQAGFSFVSNLNDTLSLDPAYQGIVPVVGLAVIKSEEF